MARRRRICINLQYLTFFIGRTYTGLATRLPFCLSLREQSLSEGHIHGNRYRQVVQR